MSLCIPHMWLTNWSLNKCSIERFKTWDKDWNTNCRRQLCDYIFCEQWIQHREHRLFVKYPACTEIFINAGLDVCLDRINQLIVVASARGDLDSVKRLMDAGVPFEIDYVGHDDALPHGVCITDWKSPVCLVTWTL